MNAMNLKPVDYKTWLRMNPDIKDKTVDRDCPECQGKGGEECFCCGHITECDGCDGSGKIKVNVALEEYEVQLKRDKRLLERFATTQN